MPHYCRLCGRRRPNERFSGRGHRIHVCRDCQALPKEERHAIEARLEIEGFLSQSHISNKNLDRLRQHTSSPDPMIANAAAVVLQVAVIAPYKRKRLRVLRRVQPDLIAAVIDLGLTSWAPLTIEQDWADLEDDEPLYEEYGAEEREITEEEMAAYALGLEVEDEA